MSEGENIRGEICISFWPAEFDNQALIMHFGR